MNNVKTLFVLIVIIATLYGCATPIGVQPKPDQGQTSFFEAGTEAIVSSKINTVVVRPENPTFQSTNKPTFVFTVENGMGAPWNFSTENVSAHFNGSPIQVFTYDELVAEVERDAAIQAIGATMASIGRSMSAANAGHQYTNVYSPYGYGTYQAYSYNAAAAQQAQATAQAQTGADFDRIAASSESALAELEGTILRKQTVFPGSWHGGYVKLSPISLSDGTNTLTFIVDVGSEHHEFVFDLNKAER